MHVPSAFENTEIPMHCHEVKIPHSSILKLFLCSSPSFFFFFTPSRRIAQERKMRSAFGRFHICSKNIAVAHSNGLSGLELQGA
jgi:hypothetical protein